jgi:hypothetical protein
MWGNLGVPELTSTGPRERKALKLTSREPLSLHLPTTHAAPPDVDLPLTNYRG